MNTENLSKTNRFKYLRLKEYHNVLPPLNYGGNFLVLKKFFEGGWHFFHFKGGKETIWGSLPK